MTPCHRYQMRRKLAWIGDIYTEKKKCQEYVKLNRGVKMEQTNNYIKRFYRNVGLLFLMISISKIKHSSFPRHFLRTLKFVLRFISFTLCFFQEKTHLKINYVLFINKRFKGLIHIWLVYSIYFTKKISETIFPLTPLTLYFAVLICENIVNKRWWVVLKHSCRLVNCQYKGGTLTINSFPLQKTLKNVPQNYFAYK